MIENKFVDLAARLLVVFIMVASWRPASAAGSRLGPSFDCEKASTEIEKAICSDSSLSSLDRVLSKVYKAKRAIPAIAEEVKRSQIEWLRTEREKCENPQNGNFEDINDSRKACLESAYRNRKEALYLLKVDPADAQGKPPIKFKLMTGRQYPLCRDYVDMLNQTGYIDAPVCERKVLREFSRFKAVKWTEISDKKEIMRIRKEQIKMGYLWPPGRKKRAKQVWLSAKKEMGAGNWPMLQMTRIDIDHDGQEDTAYRFTYPKQNRSKYGDCAYLTSYFVVYDDKEKNRRVYEGPQLSLQGPSLDDEIFYYGGRAFKARWDSWIAQYQLKINELSGIPAQVCGINMVQ